jgi:dihydroorotate dehydrogenase
VSVTQEKKCKIHGFIISNSTYERRRDEDNLKSKHANEEGGLCGVPLRDKSTKMIEDVYKLTRGETVIIGCGGVRCGQDAYEKILAGASAIQIYTSFIYHGPPVVTKIKRELSELLIKNGYASVGDAVGKGVKIEGRKRKFYFF